MCGGAWVKEEWAKNLKHSGLVAEKLKAAVQVRRSPLGSRAGRFVPRTLLRGAFRCVSGELAPARDLEAVGGHSRTGVYEFVHGRTHARQAHEPLLAEGIHPHQLTRSGVVAEWFKAAVLKTAKGETPS